jgi:hypothetical protein
MKLIVALLAAVFLVLPIAAQENATVETTTTPTAAQAARAARRRLEAQERAQRALEGKTVLVYSGFVVDLRTPEKKSKLFSLRQPADPKNDSRNLYLDERTERPKGFVLFRVGF